MSGTGAGLGRRGVLASALASLILAACGPDKPEKPQRRLVPARETPEATTAAINLSAAAILLGEKLLEALTAAKPNETVVISPIGLMFGLILIREAARGATRDEIDTALAFATQKLAQAEVEGARGNLDQRMLDTADARCDYANGLWIDPSAHPVEAFAKTKTVMPAVKVDSADLSQPGALVDINAFVAATTDGELSSAVSAIPPHAAMILISSMYYAGVWNHGFDVANTKSGPFTKADGSTVQTPMMRWTGAFGYLDSDTLQAVALPYGDARYELVLVLPKAGAHGAAWTAGLDVAADLFPGQVILPRMTLTWGADLRPALAGLGLHNAMGAAPDFGAAAAPGTPLAQVFHRTLVTIDETTAQEGPKPVASTTRTDGSALEPFVFNANRPFYLCLRETGSYAPVLLARVADPGGDTGW
jgi:serpin B